MRSGDRPDAAGSREQDAPKAQRVGWAGESSWRARSPRRWCCGRPAAASRRGVPSARRSLSSPTPPMPRPGRPAPSPPSGSTSPHAVRAGVRRPVPVWSSTALPGRRRPVAGRRAGDGVRRPDRRPRRRRRTGPGRKRRPGVVHDDRAERTGADHRPGRRGVFYGTRTLKQEVHGGGTAPEGVVRDAPAKPRRGFMLDMARKFYSAGWIEDRVRELGDLKYNELGLHFSDDQGFRIESGSHPEIVSPQHLSKAEVKRIVDLAASRHITIVPRSTRPGTWARSSPRTPTCNCTALRCRTAGHARHLEAGGREDRGRPPQRVRGGVPRWLLASGRRRVPGTDGAEPGRVLSATGRRCTGEVRGERERRRPRDRLAERPRRRDARARPDDARVERRLLPHQRGAAGQGPRGRVLDGQGAQRQAAGGVPGRGPQGDQLQRRVPLLRAGQPHTFVYPTGQRIYEQWNPRMLRGTAEVPAGYDGQILGGVLRSGAIAPPRRRRTRWRPGSGCPCGRRSRSCGTRGPPLSWTEFRQLADRLG